MLTTHNTNIFPFLILPWPDSPNISWEKKKGKRMRLASQSYFPADGGTRNRKHLAVTNGFLLKILPSSSDTFSEPSWQQSTGSDFLVKSLKLWKKTWVMARSSGCLPLAHLHRIIQVQTETINTGGITPLANTFKLSRSGNSATRAMKVNVKGQGQESNFLFLEV